MTYSPVTHIRTWNSSRRVAKLLQSIKRKYIGLEVLETFPNGATGLATIADMQWDDTVGLEGAWCVLVAYYAGTTRSWTDCSVLKLTGNKGARKVS